MTPQRIGQRYPQPNFKHGFQFWVVWAIKGVRAVRCKENTFNLIRHHHILNFYGQNNNKLASAILLPNDF